MNLLIGILGTLFFGVSVLWSSRLLSGPVHPGRENVMDVVLKTIGWTLIWSAIVVSALGMFGGLPFVALVVLDMVWTRGRRARRTAFLSTLAVAADRMMPLGPVIEAHAAEQKGQFSKQALLLASRLKSGWLLPDALDASGGLISRHARATIRTGFESGTLVAALKTAAGERDSHETVWAQLSGKLFYLSQVILFGGLLVSFVMWKIIPSFERIFVDFEIALPKITQFCIEASHAFVRFGGAIIVILFPLVAFFFIYAVFRGAGLEWDLPGVTRLARPLHAAKILDTLAPLARQGRPLLDGIGTLARVYPKRFIRRRLKWVSVDVAGGLDWCDSMARRGLMSRADRAVLQAATRVGNLPWAMTEMAHSNRRRLAYRFEVWLQIVFALIILAVGIVGAVFYLALFVPLIELILTLV